MGINNIVENKKDIFDIGFPHSDEKMTFYYDESGNCRKFLLTESGVNDHDALEGDFVLAGVAHEGATFKIDVSGLYAALDYEKGQKELKFKQLYQRSPDFLSFIGSKKATDFLNWLRNSGLYIHYSTLNNLFYSLVDIVDSLWETHPNSISYFSLIKSALYDFVLEHQSEVIDIFIRHTYPNVKNSSAFCDELCDLIVNYNDEDCFFLLDQFRQMLKMAGKRKKMVFIQDNEPLTLINMKEYHLFYLERCKVFSKSKHVFDEEPYVKETFDEIPLFENGMPINNWKFVNSQKDILVQVSDLVAGMLRKLFIFLDKNSLTQTGCIASQLSKQEINNFNTIYYLICRSDRKTPLLIKNANSHKNIEERMCKLQILVDENFR